MRPPNALQGFLISCLLLVPVLGHGRLWDPPSRSSLWRFGYDTPPNYQDMELFCGGVGVQYGVNGGKCGVCGDPWNGPRDNEAGGRYAKGIIVRSYKVGQVIDIVIDLTANHKGYFEFNICPMDDPLEKATEECLAEYPLREETTGRVKYPVPDVGYSGMIKMKFRLPEGVRCRACLLRWKYNTGNSWGVGSDGIGCLGCGEQEQFYGCADVAIGHDDVVLGVPPVTMKPQLLDQQAMTAGVTSSDMSGTKKNRAPSAVFKDTVGRLELLGVINVIIVVFV